MDDNRLIRCSCDRCGAHSATRVHDGRPAGFCSNCGCQELTPVSREAAARLAALPGGLLPIAHTAA